MSKISEQDAHEQMQTLRMLGEADAALEEVQGYGLGEPYDSEGNEARRENERRQQGLGKLRN
jgi:hypothetical protein